MINYLWIKTYCLEKPKAVLESKLDWGVDLFKIDKKWFAVVHADKAGKPIISLKCDPYLAQKLRLEYPSKIIAGYHFNKTHWNSIYLESDVTADLIKAQIDESYRLVAKKLPKNLSDLDAEK